MVGGALAGLVAIASAVSAHDLERSEVTLSFRADGAFVLEVANDPNWLLLRLESFAGGQVPAGTTPEARDRRLGELGAVFIDRLVLFVDGREIRPDAVEYVAPAPQRPEETYPPRGIFRLRGRMPADARTLRWLYGLVVDPYQITVRRANGIATAEWIEGSNWSGVIELGGQFRRTTAFDNIREYFGGGFAQILPNGLEHLLFVLGLFLLSIELRPIAMQLVAFSAGSLLTLALGTAGVLSAPADAIESLIAVSIVYVAVENMMTSVVKPWRLALVFAFGCVHGVKLAAAGSDRKSTRLNSSHNRESRMPSSA